MSSDNHKNRINSSLDPELYRRAKALGLNMSGVSERALRVYLDRLENGSGQPSVVLGPGDSVATLATDTLTDSGESSTDETDRSIQTLRLRRYSTTTGSSPRAFSTGVRVQSHPVSSDVRHRLHRLSIGERFDNALNDMVQFVGRK